MSDELEDAAKSENLDERLVIMDICGILIESQQC